MTQPTIHAAPDSIYLLFGKIDIDSAKNITEWIICNNLLDAQDRPEFLTLIINSEGGDLTPAFSIIDMMNYSKIPIHTMGTGEVYSAGLMIFMNGAKGHRSLTKNALVLSHMFSAEAQGKYHELQSAQNEFYLINERMMDHYIKCSGLTKTKVKKELLPHEDIFFSAEQAIKLGLCDKIV